MKRSSLLVGLTILLLLTVDLLAASTVRGRLYRDGQRTHLPGAGGQRAVAGWGRIDPIRKLLVGWVLLFL